MNVGFRRRWTPTSSPHKGKLLLDTAPHPKMGMLNSGYIVGTHGKEHMYYTWPCPPESILMVSGRGPIVSLFSR